jgi:ketosteroid isomerase-like protein
VSGKEDRQLEVVRALYAATGAGDWTAAESHLTDDFYVTEGSMMPFAGTYRGRHALQQLYTQVMGMMDVAALDVHAHTVGDDHVVVLLDMVLAGPPQVRVPLAEMLRFRGDKVCEIKPYYFDPAAVIAAVKAKRAQIAV